MEFLTRFKNPLFLIAVLLAQALALAVQVRSPIDPAEPDGPGVRLLRLWATGAIAPFERASHGIGSGFRFGWSDYLDLRHVRRDNAALQQQIARMRIAEASTAEDALEGRRLQALLAFREKYVAATVAAQVIGTSGSEQSHVLLIDKGWRDGLKPDMAVITQDGIVGKLRDVFPTTSQVLEINDQTAGAGVILESTRIRAILRGTVTGRVRIGNLTADSRIKPGEIVLTSGGDQVFPRGLPVGTVESIAPDPEHQPYTAITVRPAVKLAQVEEVLVITSTQSDLPLSAQQDLAAAEARHAADLRAEPLPGIFEAPAPNAASPASPSTPAAATPAVPRPLPPAHPDRFSSGTTPSAAEMTPGAPQDTASRPRPAQPLEMVPVPQPAPPDPQP
jgi:rod shape-determining protein MreC